MSRNMIEMNINLFGKLEMRLPPDTIAGFKLGREAKRYITTDEEEREWLKECEIKTFKCLYDRPVINLSYGQKNLYVLPESEITEPFMRGVLLQANNNAGVLTLIWSIEDYYFKRQELIGYNLAENVFGRDGAYLHSEMKQYFNDFDIWEVDKDIYGDNRISAFRIYGGRLISEEGKLSLAFSQTTLESIKIIFEDYPGNIIGEVVFRGLTAIHWEHAFLEFYRCIERLYSIPNARLVKDYFNTIKPISEIESFIDKKWQFREEEMLQRLLSELSENEKTILTDFCNTLSIVQSSEMNLCNVVAKKIYSIRNNIAHFRQSSSDSEGTVGDWDMLIRLMCKLIILLYSKHFDVFT